MKCRDISKSPQGPRIHLLYNGESNVILGWDGEGWEQEAGCTCEVQPPEESISPCMMGLVTWQTGLSLSNPL